jgi:hypothetical protein
MNEQPGVDDDWSLEQIEGDVWDDPPSDATNLITTVHRLRRKPIGTLTAEDLRMLIAQRLGLDVLVPRVLARLERDPLVEGDFYPADVLVATLRLPVEYWAAHPDQLARLYAVAASVTEPPGELAADIAGFRDRMRSPGR